MTDDLIAFTRCSVPGCDWRIHLRPGMTATRCYLHGGPAVAQYVEDGDGAIIRTRFMPREADPDFEPSAA